MGDTVSDLRAAGRAGLHGVLVLTGGGRRWREEALRRRLAEKVVPQIPLRFRPYDEPRYRAALQMHLGDNPIPAAIGGAHNHWSILPEGVQVASVMIPLEPWASILSGQTVDLVEGTPFPSLNRPEPSNG